MCTSCDLLQQNPLVRSWSFSQHRFACTTRRSGLPAVGNTSLSLPVTDANVTTVVIIVMVHTHTHTHPFNGPLSGTTQVSRYQKGKTNLDFTGARDSEWQWHRLGSMQVCTSLQTDNHTSTPLLSFYRPDALPATQPTVSKH